MNLEGDFILNPSQKILAVAGAIILGVTARAIWETPMANWELGFFVTLILILAIMGMTKLPLLTWIIFLFAISFCRYEFLFRDIYNTPAVFDDKKAELIGTIAQDPRQFTDYYLIEVAEVVANNQIIPGRLQLFFYRNLELNLGDKIFWKCKLLATDLRSKLLNQIFGQCKVFDIKVLATNQDSSWLGWARRQFATKIRFLLPEPEASFLLGLLAGDHDGLPKTLTTAFRNTGVSHVLAVSGYNVAQVAGAVTLFLALFCSRGFSSLLAIFVVGGFAFFTGGGASVLRAAIMGGVALLASIFGRRYSGTLAIVVAAAIMLFINPFLLRYDLGFQLSFGAALGISFFNNYLSKVFSKFIKPQMLQESLVSTISATLATAPIILYSFQIFPMISFITNVSIAPLVPMAMSLGGLSFLVSLFSTLGGRILALPTFVIIKTIEEVVVFFSRMPLFIKLALPLPLVFVWYAILIGLMLWLKKKDNLSLWKKD